IIRDLRLGHFDVLVGINLLREGLDIPEVSLVAILDADKEGFLRSERSLIQTIGRAARNLNGRAILYADRITGSMQRAIDESERRREVQLTFNRVNNITPIGVSKSVSDVMEGAHSADAANDTRNRRKLKSVAEQAADYQSSGTQKSDAKSLAAEIKQLEHKMLELARNLEFEKAALLRDRVAALKLDLIK
ncbi:MAG: helicase-related protein, partial [Pseudohongiella sp.]|nr:helicase-related protein [Pseudohongiella sp.]